MPERNIDTFMSEGANLQTNKKDKKEDCSLYLTTDVFPTVSITALKTAQIRQQIIF